MTSGEEVGSEEKSGGLFTSPRERWLWRLTLLLVVGIYATLGLAARLVELLGNQTMAAVGFLGCLVLVLLTVVTQSLRARPRGVELGITLGVVVVYVMFFMRMTLPERSHLIEYSVVAVFVFEALSERAQHIRVPFPAILAILVTSLVGLVDECIQLFLPSRHFDVEDILFNCLASLMAVVAMVVLRWGRRLAGGVD